MTSIPSQDLHAHHAGLEEALVDAARRVIASGRYILGPEVEAFEAECAALCGVPHGVGVSSGTDALLAALMALDVGPGDEVVTTPFSFFATAGAIARVGARPVFADIDPVTMNLDPGKAAALVGPRTKAIITVHLFGRAAAMEPLLATSLPIIEDGAQAILARDGTGAPIGARGICATLSFFPSKNLGGFGDAGLVLTRDAAFAARVRLLRGHGAARKYHHERIGGNFRLDELQAALLRVKLPHLSAWTTKRRALARSYLDGLAGTELGLPPWDPACVWNQFVVRVPDGRRDHVARRLASAGITTAIYYPEPLHLQPCFSALGYRPGSLPEAERACAEALALPLYPELPADSVARVIATVQEALIGP